MPQYVLAKSAIQEAKNIFTPRPDLIFLMPRYLIDAIIEQNIKTFRIVIGAGKGIFQGTFAGISLHGIIKKCKDFRRFYHWFSFFSP